MVHVVGALKIAVLICYDRRMPACWQAARAAGAEVVLVPVAGPADEPAEYFQAEIRTHARETGVYVLTAAKCGVDAIAGEPVRNDGDTTAVAPDGSILAALNGRPGRILLDVDSAALARARQRTASFDRARPVVGHQMSD
jgi:N-carbamoylputrescine amidase